MTQSDADKLIATIRALIQGGDVPPAPEPSRKKGVGNAAAPDAKACDHKFIDSDKCAKCGWSPKQQLAHDRAGGSPYKGPPQPFDAFDEEGLYQRFKARLLAECPIDPVLLHILTSRPEIQIDVEPKRVAIDGSSLKGRIASLIADGFLNDPKRSVEINKRLDATGGSVNSGNLGRALADFKVDGLIVLDGDAWRAAPGLKVTKHTIEASA